MRKLTQVHGLHPALQRSYRAELNAFIVQDPDVLSCSFCRSLILRQIMRRRSRETLSVRGLREASDAAHPPALRVSASRTQKRVEIAKTATASDEKQRDWQDT